MEYLFSPKHSLKIFWESEHFPWRYTSRPKREWVFFSEHSVIGNFASALQRALLLQVCDHQGRNGATSFRATYVW